MTYPLNVPITPPRVAFLDPRTGNISREWYIFFLSLFQLTSGSSVSLDDLQKGSSSTDLLLAQIAELEKQVQELSVQSETDSLLAQIAELQKQVQDLSLQPATVPVEVQQDIVPPVQTGDNSDITSLANLKRADFDTFVTAPSHREGRLFYDKATYSLAYYNENSQVTVNLGREQLVRVYNNTGSTIANGKVVYINGASSGWPTVTLAQADTEVASQSALGVVTADLPNGQYGYVCTSGIVNDLDTSAYSAGTRLYLSATVAGGWTSTPPLQPNYVVEVATVVESNATTGRVFVHIDKRDWFPYCEIRDTSASITLPTTPTVFKPSTTVVADGFSYDNTTGILTINDSSAYSVAIQFNAQPSASNKNIYFYAESSDDGGSTWTITRYSGRQLELVNSVETQVQVNATRYYSTGTKLRFYIWGDATVTLKTSDLTGTTPGTVTKPAYRFLMG